MKMKYLKQYLSLNYKIFLVEAGAGLQINLKIFEGSNSEELRKLIKSGDPFEHLFIGASQAYKNRRIEIASKAYLK